MTNIKIYLLAAVFILGWWYVAFDLWNGQKSTPLATADLQHNRKATLSSPYLAPLSRQRIHEALLGDTQLMASLIAEWDAEAQLLAAVGHEKIQRLPNDTFLRAQYLGRKLRSRLDGMCREGSQEVTTVFDDRGNSIEPSEAPRRFLPQTYVAASFLLALAAPEQIVAVPSGMRRLTQLYPSELMDNISLDVSPYNTERLFREEPDVAFVAHYSQPSTLEALRSQGIELFTLSHVDSFEEIQDALMRVGHVAGKPEEAELLTLFMEASFCALDNRLAVAQIDASSRNASDVLYLNHFTHFSAPSLQTFTGKLLQQLGINKLPMSLPGAEHQWQIPLYQEHIVRFRPKAIVLSTAESDILRERMLNNPAFRDVPAVQNKRIYTVDADVQDSPTQFSVLAYYDLVHTVLELGANP